MEQRITLDFQPHLDYARFSCKEMTASRFSEFMSYLLEVREVFNYESGYFSLGKGIKGCKYKISSYGISLIYDKSEDDRYLNLWLDFSGVFFSEYDNLRAMDILRRVNVYLPRVSRLDTAIDYRQPPFKVEDIMSFVNVGNYEGFQRTHFHSSRASAKSPTYYTLNLGSRESGKYHRIYDMMPKHGVDGIRFESEFKREHARTLWLLLTGDTFHIEQTIIDIGLGQYSFVDRSEQFSNGSVKDLPLVPLWQYILDETRGCWSRIIIKRVLPTMARTVSWIKRQLPRSLYRVKKAMGRLYFYEFMQEILAEGSRRFDNSDEVLIKQYQNYNLWKQEDCYSYQNLSPQYDTLQLGLCI